MVKREWQSTGLRRLCSTLKWTPVSVYRKALELGLPTGVPQGGISVYQLSLKGGFDDHEIRQILQRYNVKLRRCSVNFADRPATQMQRPRFWVDETKAFDAVRRYLALETLAQASARLRCYPWALARAYNLKFPGHRKGTRYHVAPEIWNALRKSPVYWRIQQDISTAKRRKMATRKKV